MIESITNILSQRSEYRFNTFCSLLAIVSDSEFSEELSLVFNILEDDLDSNTRVDCVEDLILKQIDEICRRMGVELDYDEALNYPDKVLAIFQLLDSVEYSEEHDVILTILGSEEHGIEILNNLHHYFNLDSNSGIHDILLNVEERFIRNTREVVENRLNSMNNENLFNDRGSRLIKLLGSGNIPYFSTFERFSEFSTVEELIKDFDHEEEVDLNNTEVLSGLVVTVLVAIHSNYKSAKEELTKVVDLILELSVDGNTLPLNDYKYIDEFLELQYVEVEDGEE